MDKVQKKREREKRVVAEMIALYCHGNHDTTGDELCPECQELIDYACKRSDRCPFMENKTFCSNCRVHCYAPAMREKIRTVMKYSGPRMIFHHPWMAIYHVVASAQEKRKLKKESQ